MRLPSDITENLHPALWIAFSVNSGNRIKLDVIKTAQLPMGLNTNRRAYMVVKMMTVATSATSVSIKTHAHESKHPRVASTPTPNEMKMIVRSSFMPEMWNDDMTLCICMIKHNEGEHVFVLPSTATSIEPFAPRRAFPLPHTVTKVTIATQRKLTQIESVTKKCSIFLAHIFSGGKSTSTKLVSVKPAMMAD